MIDLYDLEDIGRFAMMISMCVFLLAGSFSLVWMVLT